MKDISFIFGFKHAIILIVIGLLISLLIYKYANYISYEKRYQNRDSDFSHLTKKEYIKRLKKYE